MKKITVHGHLGADAESRLVGEEVVLNLRLASTSYVSKDIPKHTDWFSVSVWGKQAKALASILVKGQEILVAGSFAAVPYKSKEGEEKVELRITRAEICFCGKKDA